MIRAFCTGRGTRSVGYAIALAMGLVWGGETAEAREGVGNVVVVYDDRGGVVGTRASEIKRLRRAGKRVEIRGRICLSSCTMFLGAGNVCVNPDTRFGFHGPSYYGKPLTPERFEYWSNVIAGHYPKPLRTWFMSKGRYRQSGYFTISGRELIRLGVAQCTARQSG